ncbi:hypothetical protein GOBAR_AA36411 [Gossypium barbadense]|uniref:Uncharacterized protein n=1 Tax=Gossypium barbadense TaxID=3634 RepID=A0A2P5VZP0_GOSBA|nr:hypothetical protein GOBAR_AA36411 [Gossypium barbadense]
MNNCQSDRANGSHLRFQFENPNLTLYDHRMSITNYRLKGQGKIGDLRCTTKRITVTSRENHINRPQTFILVDTCTMKVGPDTRTRTGRVVTKGRLSEGIVGVGNMDLTLR